MINPRLFFLSILALIFLVLSFTINPWFIAGAVIIVLINQRELMNSTKNKKK